MGRAFVVNPQGGFTMANKADENAAQTQKHRDQQQSPAGRRLAAGATSTVSTSMQLHALHQRLATLRTGPDGSVATPTAGDRFAGSPLLTNDELAALQAAVVELRAHEDPMPADGVTETDPQAATYNEPPRTDPNHPQPHKEA
jgi:hypothetical protein